MKRRTFLQSTALAGLSYAILPSCTGTPAVDIQPTFKYGLQLYTVRDEMGKGLDKVLEKIASLGYQSVEMYGYNDRSYFGNNIAATKALFDKYHLISPSAHINADSFLFENNDDAWKIAVEDAVTLEQAYVTIPYLPEGRRKTLEDYKLISQRLNRAGEISKAAGLKFAYHNHDFEFNPLEGTSGYDLMLAECDPQLVKFEMDIFWVVKAGRDPKTLINEHPGRFTMWHVKDLNPATGKNIEIGQGNIDFKDIFTLAEKSGLEYYYVEQENYTNNPFDSIEQSINYLKKAKI